MPTYEYACSACGHQFEREQRMSDPPVKKCPSCGKSKARRMITQGNFILKGGGWYSDLYSGPSNKKKTEGGGESSKTSDAGSEAAKPDKENAGKSDNEKAKESAPASPPTKTKPKAASGE